MMGTKRTLTADVWNYSTLSEDGLFSICNTCGLKYRRTKGSTSNMIKHLKRKHDIECKSLADQGSVNANLGESAIEFMSGLAAEDGIPFSTIANSKRIRLSYSIASGGQTLPMTGTAVKSSVHKFYNEAKQKIINEVKEVKLSGQKFCVTTDEWTSCSNRRYLNLNLHVHGTFWNLGLSRIVGSITSKAIKDMIEARLQEFEVPFEDTFSFVTDGASNMAKLKKITGKLQQLCFSHAIHLAVQDVFYLKKANTSSSTPVQDNRFEAIEVESDEFNFSEALRTHSQEQNSQVEDAVLLGQSENTRDNEDSEEILDSTFTTIEEEIIFEPNIQEMIDKVREVVKFFRLSSLRSDVLAVYDPDEHKLKLDMKTRWNSIFEMLQRFIFMKDAIKKAYIDLQTDIPIDDEEFNYIEGLVKILAPVKITVEKICRRDATLITADVAFKLMLDKVLMSPFSLSEDLYTALKRRISERRTYMSDVAYFLHFNNENIPGCDEGYFSRMDLPTIQNHIKEIYQSFSSFDTSENNSSQQDDTEPSQSMLCEISLEAEFDAQIRSAMNFKATRNMSLNNRSLNAKLKKEIQTFQATGDRGRILEFVYNLLLAVPPSSVEAERVFSSANGFCTKTRSRLGDGALNELVFLKWYFKRTPSK